MRLFFLLLLLHSSRFVPAQDIPFIKTADVARLMQQENDTVYVLNFWATWCGPCVAELPAFERLHAAYAEKNVRILLISTDFKQQVDTKLRPFIKRRKLQCPVAWLNETNPNDLINLVSAEWTGAIPATLMFSVKKGKFLFFEQALSYDDLEKHLRSIL